MISARILALLAAKAGDRSAALAMLRPAPARRPFLDEAQLVVRDADGWRAIRDRSDALDRARGREWFL